MAYDIIGDIHGYASQLTVLLRRLGYEQRQGAWRHPERTAVFVGDFIDYGPEQLATIHMVRSMLDAGNALAVMGNHELNAIAWHTRDRRTKEDYLRSRLDPVWGPKNRKQHERFLDEVREDSALHSELVTWFLSLPLWLELPGVRVVHACWHPGAMAFLRPLLGSGDRLTSELLPAATIEPTNKAEKDTPDLSVFKAVELLLKGVEVPLPPGVSFFDKHGNERDRVRTTWWDASAVTYREAAILDESDRPKVPDAPLPERARFTIHSGSPAAFGHYAWRNGPLPLTSQFACVDNGVDKGQPLCAYRIDDGVPLRRDRFVMSQT